MVGAGTIRPNPERNEGKGSLEHLAKAKASKKRWSHLVDKKGEWVSLDDVWINYFDRYGELVPGYGGTEEQIGPELGFGHAVGEGCDEQVLLIKVAWGEEHRQGLPPAQRGRRGGAGVHEAVRGDPRGLGRR